MAKVIRYTTPKQINMDPANAGHDIPQTCKHCGSIRFQCDATAEISYIDHVVEVEEITLLPNNLLCCANCGEDAD